MSASNLSTLLPHPHELTSPLCSSSSLPSETAAHQQTRVLFSRFIPSASSSLSPFKPDPSLPAAPALQPSPEEDLTPAKVDEHIAAAVEIAQFLRTNVVQGVKTSEGNYGLSFPSFSPFFSLFLPFPFPPSRFLPSVPHSLLPPALRIHQDTERGDNDSVKNAVTPKREVPVGNEGVRRRRKRNGGAPAEAEIVAPAGGCCGGSEPVVLKQRQ